MVKVTKDGVSRFVAEEKADFYKAKGYLIVSSDEKTSIKALKTGRKKTTKTKE